MHERSALGPADVDHDTLAGFVAAMLGRPHDEVQLLDSRAEEVHYEIPAITTATRAWVRGRARVDGEDLSYSFFVKHVQSWARSPLFASVPPEFHQMAEALVPWRTEPAVYRTDLRQALPDGLTMARCFGVMDLDDKSAAIWLEEVPVSDSAPWDLGRFERAAHALGRLAASPRVAPYADVGGHEWTVRDYLDGRLSVQVIPLLRAEETWCHPLVASAFDSTLRDRLLAATDRAASYVDELLQLPLGTGHGDACPGNLLVGPDSDDFVLIDFGFWNPLPIGHDLGQLLVGDVQLGRGGTADLAERDELCLEAYVPGLRAEGCPVPAADVRRAHALQLLIFSGYTMAPIEHLDGEPTPELRAMAAERATIARYCLDLVEATA